MKLDRPMKKVKRFLKELINTLKNPLSIFQEVLMKGRLTKLLSISKKLEMKEKKKELKIRRNTKREFWITTYLDLIVSELT